MRRFLLPVAALLLSGTLAACQQPVGPVGPTAPATTPTTDVAPTCDDPLSTATCSGFSIPNG